jgi:hypothetical protein
MVYIEQIMRKSVYFCESSHSGEYKITVSFMFTFSLRYKIEGTFIKPLASVCVCPQLITFQPISKFSWNLVGSDELNEFKVSWIKLSYIKLGSSTSNKGLVQRK